MNSQKPRSSVLRCLKERRRRRRSNRWPWTELCFFARTLEELVSHHVLKLCVLHWSNKSVFTLEYLYFLLPGTVCVFLFADERLVVNYSAAAAAHLIPQLQVVFLRFGGVRPQPDTSSMTREALWTPDSAASLGVVSTSAARWLRLKRFLTF